MDESTVAPPAPRWLKHVALCTFEDALRLMGAIGQSPPGRPDIHVPDDDDVEASLLWLLKLLEKKMEKAKALGINVTRCEVLAVMCYTMESPYPWYRLMNGWIMTERRDDKIKKHVGPMALLLITGLRKMPSGACGAPWGDVPRTHL